MEAPELIENMSANNIGDSHKYLNLNESKNSLASCFNCPSTENLEDNGSKLDDIYKDALCDASASFISKIKLEVDEEHTYLFDDPIKSFLKSPLPPKIETGDESEHIDDPIKSFLQSPLPSKMETGDESEHTHNREGFDERIGGLEENPQTSPVDSVDIQVADCWDKLFLIGFKKSPERMFGMIEGGSVQTIVGKSLSKDNCCLISPEAQGSPTEEVRSNQRHVEVPLNRDYFVVERSLARLKTDEFNLQVKIKFINNEAEGVKKAGEPEVTVANPEGIGATRRGDGLDLRGDKWKTGSGNSSRSSVSSEALSKSATSITTSSIEYYAHPGKEVYELSRDFMTRPLKNGSPLNNDFGLDDRAGCEDVL